MNTKLLRQKILDLAIRGKLVPQDPNDEPASVLLEKIRAEKERLIKEKKIKPDKSKNTADRSNYRNEQPFEIPESWEWVKTGEIFLINPKNSLDDNTTISFIPMRLISDGFTNEHKSEVKKWKEVKKGFTHFQEGDVAIAKITPCFENRKSVILKDLENYFGAGTTELYILRPILEPSIANYTLWMIKTDYFINHGISQFSGAVGQQRVGKNILEETCFPLPPLSEQNRIVAEIERLFKFINTIEENKFSIEEYFSLMKSKVLDLAIRGKLVAQDPNDEPASVLLERIGKGKKVTSDKTKNKKLLKGWIDVQLQDISKITMGQSPSGESVSYNPDGVEFHQGKIHFTEKYLAKSNSYTVKPTKIIEEPSVLLCVRAPVGVVNISKNIICIGRGLCAITPLENISIYFIYYWMKNLEKSFIEKSTGSTFQSISMNTVRECVIPLPPLAEQQRIVFQIEKIFEILLPYFDFF